MRCFGRPNGGPAVCWGGALASSLTAMRRESGRGVHYERPPLQRGPQPFDSSPLSFSHPSQQQPLSYSAPHSAPPPAARPSPVPAAGTTRGERAASHSNERRQRDASSVTAAHIFGDAFPNSFPSLAAGTAAAHRWAERSHKSRHDENARKVRKLFPAELSEAVLNGKLPHGRNPFSPYKYSIQGRLRKAKNPLAWVGVRGAFDSVPSAVFPGLPASATDKQMTTNAPAKDADAADARTHQTASAVPPVPQGEEELAALPPEMREDVARFRDAYALWVETNKQIIDDNARLLDTQREMQRVAERQRSMAKEVVQEVVDWTWWFMLPMMTLLLLSIAVDARSWPRQMAGVEFVDYDEVLKELKKRRAAGSAESEQRDRLLALAQKMGYSPQQQQQQKERKRKKGGGKNGGSSGEGGASGGPQQRDVKID